MRVLIFFDLPTETAADRQTYRRFRKFLIEEGFIMLQESVYVKLALNGSIVSAVSAKLQAHAPPKGMVQFLIITEKQFANMKYIAGSQPNDVVDSVERYVLL